MILSNKQLRNHLRDALANVKASMANSITNKIAAALPLSADQAKFLKNALADQKGILSAKIASGIAARKASFTGQKTGMTTPVTITANTAGIAGNSVSLNFDGSTTIAARITTWNAANPSNQVTLTSGIGTQTPANLQVIALAGGSATVALSASEKKQLQSDLADNVGQLTAKIAAGVDFSS